MVSGGLYSILVILERGYTSTEGLATGKLKRKYEGVCIERGEVNDTRNNSDSRVGL